MTQFFTTYLIAMLTVPTLLLIIGTIKEKRDTL